MFTKKKIDFLLLLQEIYFIFTLRFISGRRKLLGLIIWFFNDKSLITCRKML